VRTVRIAIALALACFVAAACAASAGATVTIGQTGPATESPFCFGFADFDEATQTPASGAGYAVPAGGGVITSWSTMGGLEEGSPQELGFDVLRRTGYATYTKAAEDPMRQIKPEAMNTFPVDMQVKGGDLIGVRGPSILEDSTSACVFFTEDPNDENSYSEPAIEVGESAEFTFNDTEVRVNASATVLRPPTISSLSPASGSVTGSEVTIGGAEFAKVGGVSFGGVPAASYSVDSEGQITATAPKAKTTGEVPVTVTTEAGTTAVPATFTYAGCEVPKLKGKKLKAVKSGLKAAGCKLGKVTKKKGATPATGKVAGQKPKAGTLAAPGAKVKVTLAG
jgi:hypothetical protein